MCFIYFFLQCVDVNLVAETDNFVWKSHSKLDMKKEAVKYPSGMQVSKVFFLVFFSCI